MTKERGQEGRQREEDNNVQRFKWYCHMRAYTCLISMLFYYSTLATAGCYSVFITGGSFLPRGNLSLSTLFLHDYLVLLLCVAEESIRSRIDILFAHYRDLFLPSLRCYCCGNISLEFEYHVG